MVGLTLPTILSTVDSPLPLIEQARTPPIKHDQTEYLVSRDYAYKVGWDSPDTLIQYTRYPEEKVYCLIAEAYKAFTVIC